MTVVEGEVKQVAEKRLTRFLGKVIGRQDVRSTASLGSKSLGARFEHSTKVFLIDDPETVAGVARGNTHVGIRAISRSVEDRVAVFIPAGTDLRVPVQITREDGRNVIEIGASAPQVSAIGMHFKVEKGGETHLVFRE